MVVDCRLNKKNFSIFEGHETKLDTMDMLLTANVAFARENESKRLKISLV